MRISDLSSDVCSSDLGNIAGLLTGKNTPADPATLFDTPFSQFIKAETDSRSYFHINDGLTWANRLIVGAGLPYGNSLTLPFEIGRASCRARVCQSVSISGVAGPLNKKKR